MIQGIIEIEKRGNDMFFIILALTMIIHRFIPDRIILDHPKQSLAVAIVWLCIWVIIFAIFNESIFMIVALIYSLIGLYIQAYLMIFGRRNKRSMRKGTILLGAILLLLVGTMMMILYR